MDTNKRMALILSLLAVSTKSDGNVISALTSASRPNYSCRWPDGIGSFHHTHHYEAHAWDRNVTSVTTSPPSPWYREPPFCSLAAVPTLPHPPSVPRECDVARWALVLTSVGLSSSIGPAIYLLSTFKQVSSLLWTWVPFFVKVQFTIMNCTTLESIVTEFGQIF